MRNQWNKFWITKTTSLKTELWIQSLGSVWITTDMTKKDWLKWLLHQKYGIAAVKCSRRERSIPIYVYDGTLSDELVWGMTLGTCKVQQKCFSGFLNSSCKQMWYGWRNQSKKILQYIIPREKRDNICVVAQKRKGCSIRRAENSGRYDPALRSQRIGEAHGQPWLMYQLSQRQSTKVHCLG